MTESLSGGYSAIQKGIATGDKYSVRADQDGADGSHFVRPARSSLKQVQAAIQSGQQ